MLKENLTDQALHFKTNSINVLYVRQISVITKNVFYKARNMIVCQQSSLITKYN